MQFAVRHGGLTLRAWVDYWSWYMRHNDADRVHLIAPANPFGRDAARLGFKSPAAYAAFAGRHLPDSLRVTCDAQVMSAREREWHGGRSDDARRIRDIQRAMGDPRTVAMVATNGGAYLTRILPDLDFSVLARRRRPLWVLGFSEISTLVNLAAGYRGGRGVYWLCPNYLGWKIEPREKARQALADFWRVLAAMVAGRRAPQSEFLPQGPIRGELVQGRASNGRIRIVGGCLAVLAAAAGGSVGRRLRPRGQWLLLEDLRESPYRIDRHLAALKLAGWFDRVSGVLLGDFRMLHADTQPAVIELLRYHLPAGRRLPVVATHEVGHVYPLKPVPINRAVELGVNGGRVTISWGWACGA